LSKLDDLETRTAIIAERRAASRVAGRMPVPSALGTHERTEL